MSYEQIRSIIAHFSENTYHAKSTDEQFTQALSYCIELMEKDYNIIKIDNTNGELCFQYPSVIPIIISNKFDDNHEQSDLMDKEARELRNLFNIAKFARCRQRFPVPVILFEGKNICRSATLASIPEVCYRAGVTDVGIEALYALTEFLWPTEDNTVHEEHATKESEGKDEKAQKNWPFCDKIRSDDIQLLRKLKVDTIYDIMVEKRKIKHGLYVSSSEKVDKDRYSEFKLVCLPYPGCEFFKTFNERMYKAENIYFDWSQPAFDANLSIVENYKGLKINWDKYKSWELIKITQNYLKYIIRSLQENSSGMLLHCISGWDRTPLFMSLLRISLWADGLVHQSLDEYQLLYFTIVYDWVVFGHHLSNRIYKGEEVFPFCFRMLQFIQSDDYSARSKIMDSGLAEAKSFVSSFELINGPDSEDPALVATSSDSPAPTVEEPLSHNLNLEEDSDPVMSTSVPRSTPMEINGRRRSTSSDSNDSTNGWTTITSTGSVESESHFSQFAVGRAAKLAKVSTTFFQIYMKTVKNDSYGPPRSVVEDCIQILADTFSKH